MANSKSTVGIKSRRNRDGSVSFDAQLYVKPFARIQQTFGTRADAFTWRSKMKAELLDQRKQGSRRADLATLTVAGLNAEYVKDPETQKLAYFKDLKRHLEWWTLKYGTVKVLDFGVLQLREARDALIPGRAAATVVRRLSSQRSAWNWGRAAGLVPEGRVWPPRLMLTEPDARTRYLSDDELKAVLRAAKAHSPTVFAAVAVALATGVRRGELLRLTWAEVDLPRTTIRLLITKNGSARSVHLPSIAADALKAIKAGTVVSTKHVFLCPDGQPYDGGRLHQAWLEIRKTAKLQNFRWHDLRHTAASFLAQHGASLVEIGSVLGHKSAQVTLKYSHLVEGRAVTGHAALDEKLRGAT